MDCVASIARSDCSIIGTWRDDIRIDQEAVKAYVGGEFVPHGGAEGPRKDFDIKAEVIDLCPTKCMEYDGKSLKIYNADCVRCMHCIRVMPQALRPGLDTGATILVGAKAPILEGAQLSSVVIPFIKMESPYTEFKEFVEKCGIGGWKKARTANASARRFSASLCASFSRRSSSNPIHAW